MGDDAAIGQLRSRLRRYDPERYPIQHATTQFHLGLALAQAGRNDEAVACLRTAVDRFAPLPVEQAKARNMLGAALRECGDPAEAESAFSAAAEVFAEHGLTSEHAAARYNLGLVRAGLGRSDAAVDCFADAERGFLAGRQLAQAAAAARELGAARLAAGDPAEATGALERAVSNADRAADLAGRGAAANALGLARLAAGDTAGAVKALRTAEGAHPRRVRPAGYAMVQANLALAYERAGQPDRAAFAARHALGARGAADAVRRQARGVLDRLPAGAGPLVDVLDDEPVERWAAVVRDEVERWLEAPPSERRTASRGWIEGVLARPARGPELVHAWLGVLLELPPDDMDTAIGDALQALGERDDEERRRFQDHTSRAFVRFHGPQWQRLADTFNRIAGDRGEEPTWR